MRFEQTRNILNKLAPAYHRKVSDIFQDFSEGEVSPRNRLMLDYLIDHEEHRALALGEFCNGTSSKLLEQWLTGLEVNFPQVPVGLLDDGARFDLDLLIKAAVGYKKVLIEYYLLASTRCTNKETCQLFDKLRNQEEKAMKRMIRHAQGLADL